MYLSFFLFFRHAFSELPRPIALKLCHMVGIWPYFIIPLQKFGGIRAISDTMKSDSDDVMCRHHRPRLISNPIDNDQLQRQSSLMQRLMHTIHHGRPGAVQHLIYYRREVVCRYFDTLLESRLDLQHGPELPSRSCIPYTRQPFANHLLVL